MLIYQRIMSFAGRSSSKFCSCQSLFFGQFINRRHFLRYTSRQKGWIYKLFHFVRSTASSKYENVIHCTEDILWRTGAKLYCRYGFHSLSLTVLRIQSTVLWLLRFPTVLSTILFLIKNFFTFDSIMTLCGVETLSRKLFYSC